MPSRPSFASRSASPCRSGCASSRASPARAPKRRSARSKAPCRGLRRDAVPGLRMLRSRPTPRRRHLDVHVPPGPAASGSPTTPVRRLAWLPPGRLPCRTRGSCRTASLLLRRHRRPPARPPTASSPLTPTGRCRKETSHDPRSHLGPHPLPARHPWLRRLHHRPQRVRRPRCLPRRRAGRRPARSARRVGGHPRHRSPASRTSSRSSAWSAPATGRRTSSATWPPPASASRSSPC